MEITDDYSKLCQKVWEQRNYFYRKYSIEPNIVNVGYEEFDILTTGNQFISENGRKEDRKDYTFFGMKLKRVTEDNYCAVGFVIE